MLIVQQCWELHVVLDDVLSETFITLGMPGDEQHRAEYDELSFEFNYKSKSKSNQF
jgi:hypothetical protein